MAEEVMARVIGYTDDELLDMLLMHGVEDAGPISSATRRAYEKVLVRRMLGESYVATESGTEEDDTEEDSQADDDDDDGNEDDDDDGDDIESGSELRRRRPLDGTDGDDEDAAMEYSDSTSFHSLLTLLKVIMAIIILVLLMSVFGSTSYGTDPVKE